MNQGNISNGIFLNYFLLRLSFSLYCSRTFFFENNICAKNIFLLLLCIILFYLFFFSFLLVLMKHNAKKTRVPNKENKCGTVNVYCNAPQPPLPPPPQPEPCCFVLPREESIEAFIASGAPSPAFGKEGDIYFQMDNGHIWKRGPLGWVDEGAFCGCDFPDVDGVTHILGTGSPESFTFPPGYLPRDGDFYTDTLTNNLYYFNADSTPQWVEYTGVRHIIGTGAPDLIPPPFPPGYVPKLGDFYTDSNDERLYYYDGTDWVPYSSHDIAVRTESSPVSAEGQYLALILDNPVAPSPGVTLNYDVIKGELFNSWAFQMGLDYAGEGDVPDYIVLPLTLPTTIADNVNVIPIDPFSDTSVSGISTTISTKYRLIDFPRIICTYTIQRNGDMITKTIAVKEPVRLDYEAEYLIENAALTIVDGSLVIDPSEYTLTPLSPVGGQPFTLELIDPVGPQLRLIPNKEFIVDALGQLIMEDIEDTGVSGDGVRIRIQGISWFAPRIQYVVKGDRFTSAVVVTEDAGDITGVSWVALNAEPFIGQGSLPIDYVSATTPWVLSPILDEDGMLQPVQANPGLLGITNITDEGVATAGRFPSLPVDTAVNLSVLGADTIETVRKGNADGKMTIHEMDKNVVYRGGSTANSHSKKKKIVGKVTPLYVIKSKKRVNKTKTDSKK